MHARGISARLWEENSEKAQTALHHPFVQQMGLETLPEHLFEAYMWQDIYYLQCFEKGYKTALEKASDQPPQIQESLKDLHKEVVEELGQVHERFLGANKTPEDFQPNAATLKYTAFLDRIGKSEDLASILAAMTPCNKLYAYLGKKLKEGFPQENHRYGTWINFYTAQDFKSSASKIEAILDHCALTENFGKLADLYGTAMQLEIDFFEAHRPT